MKIGALDELKIGRNPAANLQKDQVTGDQVAGVDIPPHAVPDHRCVLLFQVAERRRRPAGRVFLCCADDSVDQQHDADE